MPEGNFFAPQRDLVRARTGDAREGVRPLRDEPLGGVYAGPRARESPEQDEAPLSLRIPRSFADFVGILKRRWLIIGATAVLFAAGATVVTMQLPTHYRADAVILLGTGDLQLPDISPAVPSQPFDATRVRGEMEVIKSRSLAESVARKLHLTDQPEFVGTATPARGAGDAARNLQRAVDGLLARLNVENDGHSFALKIDFAANSPQLAAKIANAYADLYLEHQIAAKTEATRRASEWLNRQIASLRDQIVATEERIGKYKQEYGITSAQGATVTGQEFADINTQLIAAHSDRIQKDAALRYAMQVIASPGGAEAAGQLFNSPLIQRLREQEADLMRRIAEMSTRYLPAHPTMIRMHAELDDLRHKIVYEANRIVRTMADDAKAARTREEALKASLVELSSSTAQQEGARIELRELEREAAASRSLYENLLTRFKQTSAQQEIQQPDAQIISRADALASRPSPNKKRLFVSWAGLSLVIGVFAALALELIDPSFRRPEEIETEAGLPVLGLLPAIEPRRAKGAPAPQAEAILSEALRGIRGGLRDARGSAPMGVLLVTSLAEGEGKTFFAIALGRSVARARLRCLVIDCHFQRPGVEGFMSPAPAQSGAVLGTYPQIKVDAQSGLHYVAAPAAEQRRVFRSQDLFESPEMRSYILRMRGHYDLIILDAPPLPAIADVIALSRLADAAVFLIRWGRTPRRAALNALRLLTTRGISLGGIVLSRVELKRYATYGYRDYVRYLRGDVGTAARR